MNVSGVRGWIAALCLVPLACTRSAPEASGPLPSAMRLEAPPEIRFPSTAALHERRGTGAVRYLGFDLEPPPPLTPGASVELRHYFKTEAPLMADYAVALELRTPGASAALLRDAHRPVSGQAPSSRWAAGDIWMDVHRLRVPAELPGPAVEVLVALVNGGERMTVEAPPGRSDGADFVRAATVTVDATGARPADGLPDVTIPRSTSTITADGKLDEPAWARAPILRFQDTMGRKIASRSPTQLRLLWDDQNLYVGFECVDRDITDPFSKRDDPIYDHETVEVFLMPNVVAPGLGPYVELQASPRGVIFDAAFTGRRQGMDKGFDAQQTVGTTVDGTLDDPAPDRGWVSEWVVPWKSVRYVTRSPKVGEEWRMNAFRIEKNQREGPEFTAWSPPMVGDFHAVDRFGRLRFGP